MKSKRWFEALKDPRQNVICPAKLSIAHALRNGNCRGQTVRELINDAAARGKHIRWLDVDLRLSHCNTPGCPDSLLQLRQMVARGSNRSNEEHPGCAEPVLPTFNRSMQLNFGKAARPLQVLQISDLLRGARGLGRRPWSRHLSPPQFRETPKSCGIYGRKNLKNRISRERNSKFRQARQPAGRDRLIPSSPTMTLQKLKEETLPHPAVMTSLLTMTSSTTITLPTMMTSLRVWISLGKLSKISIICFTKMTTPITTRPTTRTTIESTFKLLQRRCPTECLSSVLFWNSRMADIHLTQKYWTPVQLCVDMRTCFPKATYDVETELSSARNGIRA